MSEVPLDAKTVGRMLARMQAQRESDESAKDDHVIAFSRRMVEYEVCPDSEEFTLAKIAYRMGFGDGVTHARNHKLS